MFVRNYMSAGFDVPAEGPTVAAGETIERAARLMLDRRAGLLGVVEDGRVIGIITVFDLLHALLTVIPPETPGARVALELVGGDILDLLRRRVGGLVIQSLAFARDPVRNTWSGVVRLRGRRALSDGGTTAA